MEQVAEMMPRGHISTRNKGSGHCINRYIIEACRGSVIILFVAWPTSRGSQNSSYVSV